jgi:plastocyanin
MYRLQEWGRQMNNNGLGEAFKRKLTRRRFVGSTSLAAIATAFLAACGGGGGDDSSGGGGGGGDADITVKMLGTSAVTFHFEPDSIELVSGVEVTLEFINESAQPHSFTIAGLVDTDVIKNPGSDATSTKSKKTVTFTPTEPKETIFYCKAHGPQSESGKVVIT